MDDGELEQTQSLQLADYMDLFSGDIHNYGVHHYHFGKPGEKEDGKNSTAKNKLLTIEQYRDHLSGKVGLGVVPINEKGEVKFGVIDIDVYDQDLNMYVQAMERGGFPLVPFKSKSGGLHVYMFLRQAVDAKAMLEILRTMVVLLGLDLYVKHKLNRIIELFPKQTSASGKDVGSWINLPYYDSRHTRQAAVRGGKELSLDEALAYAKEKRRSMTELRSFLDQVQHQDGPPCLQTIHTLGIMGSGMGRNNYLFSFGVYLKKKDPEFWEQKLFETNAAMAEPLGRDELEGTVINSLRKKDYAYKCGEAPCVDFCRKTMCKTRDFGIGKDGGYFSEVDFGQLVQVKAYEPYYEWQVKLKDQADFVTMRFKNEADIIGQDSFLRLCVRDLHRLPVKVRQAEWYKLINQALSDMKIMEVASEDDTTPIGLFKIILLEFLTERAKAQTKEQILNKRVYQDERTGTYYFRSQDLSEFVFVARQFRYFAPGELHGILRDFGAKPTRVKTESGKQVRVYEMSEAAVEKAGHMTAPVFEADYKEDKEAF